MEMHKSNLTQAPSLPTHASIKSLRKSFFSHFKDKISLIHSAFIGHSDIIDVDCPQVNSQLESFEPQLLK